jgi:hypothetical protein
LDEPKLADPDGSDGTVAVAAVPPGAYNVLTHVVDRTDRKTVRHEGGPQGVEQLGVRQRVRTPPVLT